MSVVQQLLDALQAFCSEYDKQVNVGKTEVVVFDRKRYSGAAVWQYQGQQVPVSQQFRYLGVQFHSTQGVSVCTDALAAAGSRAMWAMLARCKEHGIRSLSMQVQLFNSLVSPILCYCSEVWGPALLSQAGSGAALVSKLQNNVISRVQFTFLRTLAGRVRKSTARLLLSREFGAQPLVSLWLRAAVGMWNRVVDLDASSLLACAMRDNLRLSTTSSSGAVWYICGACGRVAGGRGLSSDGTAGSATTCTADYQQASAPAPAVPVQGSACRVPMQQASWCTSYRWVLRTIAAHRQPDSQVGYVHRSAAKVRQYMCQHIRHSGAPPVVQQPTRQCNMYL